jgi:hypothetical protein
VTVTLNMTVTCKNSLRVFAKKSPTTANFRRSFAAKTMQINWQMMRMSRTTDAHQSRDSCASIGELMRISWDILWEAELGRIWLCLLGMLNKTAKIRPLPAFSKCLVGTRFVPTERRIIC